MTVDEDPCPGSLAPSEASRRTARPLTGYLLLQSRDAARSPERPQPGLTVGPVRQPLTQDDLDELYARARTPAQRRAAAEQLAAWAEEEHPEDDVSPASLLVSAGEHLSVAGDHDAALDLFRRAASARGHVPPDVRCYLHHGLMEVGDLDGACQVADGLRRERPADGDVYLFIGEDYELAGHLQEAHRWLTMGVLRSVSRVEDGDERAADDAAGLMAARLRVRRALDLPMDEYDELVTTALLDR
jgi:tetratricopeptide (TPR) repeat protein